MSASQSIFMRCIGALVLLGLSSPVTTAFGDILTVEATGEVTSITQGTIPFDSSVYVGAPVTETFNIDTDVAPFSSNSVATVYGPLTETGSITLGNYSFSGTTDLIQVISTYPTGDMPTLYGYDIYADTFPDGSNGFSESEIRIDLFGSTTPSAFPVPNLSSIQQLPLSDFDEDQYMALDESPYAYSPSNTESSVMSSITSYTVTDTVTTVPEPRQSALILLGGVLLVALSRKLRRLSKP